MRRLVLAAAALGLGACGGEGGGSGADASPRDAQAADARGLVDAPSPPDASPDVISCRTIRELGQSTGDGVYTLATLETGSFDAYCDMTRDGGGWTLVASYVAGSAAVPPVWTVGGLQPLYDPAVTFKMPDALATRLVVDAWRAHGTASACSSGPCAIDVTRFWSGACAYDSAGQGNFCTTAYLDPEFTQPTAAALAATPCTWHYGLVDSTCGAAGTFVTSHEIDPYGVSVCIGDDAGTWSCSGRNAESATLEIWVR